MMYMEITLTEFRKNTKKYFDMSLSGETVCIDRGGVHYHLTARLPADMPITVETPTPRHAANRGTPASVTVPVIEKKPPSATPINGIHGVGVYETPSPVKLPTTIQDASPAVNLCKVHGVPLTVMGKCLMKGCKYA